MSEDDTEEYIINEVGGLVRPESPPPGGIDPNSPDGTSKIIIYLKHHMFHGTDPLQLMEKHVSKRAAEHFRAKVAADPSFRIMLWRVLYEYLTEPEPRKRLSTVTCYDDVVDLLKRSNKIIIVTGAGVSVSCGIPDFRSRDGVYARLAVDFPTLPDPTAMFDIDYFRQNPFPFYTFASELWPGNFTPSPAHRFIAKLDSQGKLLRNYTQNIDTLEQVAGIKNVIQCHGSFATATCMRCGKKYTAEDIKDKVFAKEIPYCNCSTSRFDKENEENNYHLPIIKPDIVFFGESLTESFHKQIDEDKNHPDLVIVIGSSMKVAPVSLIPHRVSKTVPQILINRESLKSSLHFDVELLGDCDDIITNLDKAIKTGQTGQKETKVFSEVNDYHYYVQPIAVGKENKRYIFKGAEHVINREPEKTNSDQE